MSNKKNSKVWEYFSQLPNSVTKNGKARCNMCKSEIAVVDYSTSSLLKHLKTHNIHLNVKKREREADPEAEKPLKNYKTMMDYIQRPSLQEIVSKMATVDGISIRAITRSEFIRESVITRGFKLPKNETDVMKLIQNHFEAKKNEMTAEISERISNNQRFSLTLDE